MKLSLIIPAYNEEKLLGACLSSAKEAIAGCGITSDRVEIIVCDNNSTDATAAVARDAGARVVFEPVNQISRARNSGAKAASGDWFLFIDADSWLKAATLGKTLAAMRSGRYAGGGAAVGFDRLPTYRAQVMVNGWNLLSRSFKVAAGSYLFCRADAFRDVGGFSEKVFAAEELVMSQAIKRWGRERGLGFVIVQGAPHISSGRKLYLYKESELLALALKLVFTPLKAVSGTKHLSLFYDGRR
ncbi:MAG: glycosyltransferase [Planctomycetota bacterium]|nr:glycosyltransferase [Planctomycetota bacterium]